VERDKGFGELQVKKLKHVLGKVKRGENEEEEI